MHSLECGIHVGTFVLWRCWVLVKGREAPKKFEAVSLVTCAHFNNTLSMLVPTFTVTSLTSLYVELNLPANETPRRLNSKCPGNESELKLFWEGED
jgi:hypothetical protein